MRKFIIMLLCLILLGCSQRYYSTSNTDPVFYNDLNHLNPTQSMNENIQRGEKKKKNSVIFYALTTVAVLTLQLVIVPQLMKR